MRVTCSGAFSRRAANRPANPPPTITTRREFDVAAMAHPDPSVVSHGLRALDGHRGRATARGHRPDEGIAGIGAGPAGPGPAGGSQRFASVFSDRWSGG